MIRCTVMADGLGFPEGPIALPDGSVILSEIALQRITHVLPDAQRPFAP